MSFFSNTVMLHGLGYEDEILPKLGDFQLLGDSLLVRFADHILHQPNRYINGSRTIGLCVSGQRIDQLRNKIKNNFYPVSSKVLLLIGTNDVLCGSSIKAMISDFKRLLRLLKKKAKEIVILTLPPVPKLSITFNHWTLIRRYNFFLKLLGSHNNIKVADICPLFTKLDQVFSYDIEYEKMLKSSFSSNRVLNTSSSLSFVPGQILKGTKRKFSDRLKLDSLSANSLPDCGKKENNSPFQEDSQENKKMRILNTMRRRSELNKKNTVQKNDSLSDSHSSFSSTLTSSSLNNSDIFLDENSKVQTFKNKIGAYQRTPEYDKSNEESPKEKDCETTTENERTPERRKSLTKISPRLFLRSIGEITGKNYLSSNEVKTASKNVVATNSWIVESVHPSPEINVGKKKSPRANEDTIMETDVDYRQHMKQESPRTSQKTSKTDSDVFCLQSIKKESPRTSSDKTPETETEMDNLQRIKNRKNDDKKIDCNFNVNDFNNCEKSFYDIDNSGGSDLSDEENLKSKQQIRPYIDWKFVDFMKNHSKLEEPRSSERKFPGIFNHSKAVLPSPIYTQTPVRSMDRPPLPSSFLKFLASTPPPPPPPPPPPMPSPPSTPTRGSPFASRRIWSSSTPNTVGKSFELPEPEKSIMEYSETVCHLDCYEKYYSFGRRRIDLIHLNFRGLCKLKDFLMKHDFVTC